MRTDLITSALGLENIDATVPSASEPSELVEVVPGEVESIELAVKEQSEETADLIQTAETFGEVKEGLESIREQFLAMRGKTVSAEAMAYAGIAIRNQLRRLRLKPKQVIGLEAFSEPDATPAAAAIEMPAGVAVSEVGTAPVIEGKTDTQVEETGLDAQADMDDATGVTKEDQDAAKVAPEAGKDAVVELVEEDNNGDTNAAIVSTEDADLGGTDATEVAEAVEEAEEAVAEASAKADDAAADEVVAEAEEGERPRVEITITDDQLEVAIESLGEFIDKLQVGQEGLLDKAIKAASDQIASLFKGYESIGKRANNVIMAGKVLKGEPRKAEVTTASAHKLVYKGKVDVASIEAGLKATKSVGKVIVEDVPKKLAARTAAAAKEYLLRTEKVRKGIQSDLTDHDFEAFNAADDKVFSELSAIFQGTSAEFIGGKRMVVKKEPGIGAAEVTVVEIENVGGNVQTTVTVPTLTPAQIASVGRAVLEVSNYLVSKEQVVANARKALREALETVNSLHTDENTKRLGKSLKRMRWIYALINRIENAVVTDFTKTTFSSMRSALQLAEKSISLYQNTQG